MKMDFINQKMNIRVKPTAIDLFCGCGGMTTGIKDKCNVLCSIDYNYRKLEAFYKNNKNIKSLKKNLREFSPEELRERIDGKNVDAIVGGLPSENFKKDPFHIDNVLYIEFHKYVDHFEPKVFAMVFTDEILGKQDVIVNICDIMKIKYRYATINLNLIDFGIPHDKIYVLIIGVRKDIKQIPEIVLPKRPENVRADSIFIDKPDRLLFLKKPPTSLYKDRYIKFDRPIPKISNNHHRQTQKLLIKKDDSIRRLSIIEIKRAHGLPDNYDHFGIFKNDLIPKICKTVPPCIARFIGDYIDKVLSD